MNAVPASRGARLGVLLSSLLLAADLAGCAAQQKSLGKMWDDWTGSSEATSSKGPAVYWTSVDDLDLHSGPSFSSEVISVLPLHQKVYRDAVEHGFARVVTDGGGKRGWVDNAKLTWKAPGRTPVRGADAAGAPAEGGEPPTGESAAASEEAAVAPAETMLGDPPVDEVDVAPAAVPVSAEAAPVAGPRPSGNEAPSVSPAVFDPF